MPVLAGDGHQHTAWVLAYDERRGQHHVLYDDAEEEWVHLPTDATSWAAGPPSCPTHGGLPPGAIFGDAAFGILLSLLPLSVTSVMFVVKALDAKRTERHISNSSEDTIPYHATTGFSRSWSTLHLSLMHVIWRAMWLVCVLSILSCAGVHRLSAACR